MENTSVDIPSIDDGFDDVHSFGIHKYWYPDDGRPCMRVRYETWGIELTCCVYCMKMRRSHCGIDSPRATSSPLLHCCIVDCHVLNLLLWNWVRENMRKQYGLTTSVALSRGTTQSPQLLMCTALCERFFNESETPTTPHSFTLHIPNQTDVTIHQRFLREPRIKWWIILTIMCVGGWRFKRLRDVGVDQAPRSLPLVDPLSKPVVAMLISFGLLCCLHTSLFVICYTRLLCRVYSQSHLSHRGKVHCRNGVWGNEVKCHFWVGCALGWWKVVIAGGGGGWGGTKSFEKQRVGMGEFHFRTFLVFLSLCKAKNPLDI